MATSAVETDVLIIGAGPSGASAAALLATYGVSTIMLNKYGAVANAPRAHITNQRAMEVLRDLGLEDEAVEAATPQHLMGEHVWATSLAGAEIGRLRTWYTHPHFKAEHDLGSPSSVCDIPQDIMEPILVNAASYRGSKVRFNTELISFTQDADGVTATVVDRLTGSEYEIKAKYMIGADGGRSKVAEMAGLPFEGEMGLGGSINVVFKADLSKYVEHRPGDMYWFIQPGVGHAGMGIGVLRVVRTWNRWVGVSGYDVNAGEPNLTNELGVEIAHKLIGDDSVEVEVESLSTWAVNHMWATNNTAGRIFCVGDAVHRHSPMNGLGSNTSIQDSYNLAWKLAMVLKGQAGTGLLDTYRQERVPVAEHLIDRVSRSNHLIPPMFMALHLPPTSDEAMLSSSLATLNSHSADSTSFREAFDQALHGTLMCYNSHGMELNQYYQSTGVVTDGAEAPEPPRDPEVYYFASTFPGRHLPHVWLTKDQRQVALFDLCGKGRFTLLTRELNDAWREAAAKASMDLGIDLKVVSIGRGCDFEDSYGDFAGISEIGEDGAILVRPDHMVAWRSAAAGDAPAADLEGALRAILAR
jgi:2,4-dichlorophenol 6-monooxygenase